MNADENSALGHPYYFNAAIQQSTYTRPTEIQAPVAQQAFGAPHYTPQGVLTGIPDLTQSNGRSYVANPYGSGQGQGNFRGDHHNRPRPQLQDRPKRKHIIPECPPWLLVETKLGRRFVFNPEENESYWKFLPEVMRGVIEYDRLEREKKERLQGAPTPSEDKIVPRENEARGISIAAGEVAATERGIPGASPLPAVAAQNEEEADVSDGYEEVEITDDENEVSPSKRQKTEDSNEQHVEFNEDDMAYQLAAMGQDYGLDPGEYGDDGEDFEEGAEGLQLTEEDSNALFRDLLDDYNIGPYTTWEKVIDGGQIVEDDRYTVLPNMKSRKEVWGQWSRERIQQLKEQREKEEKKDPRIPYLAFLQTFATPKLYWPEFRRKYKKEAEMRDSKLSDKDREKWYRDYINRMFALFYCMIVRSPSYLGLKLPERTLLSDLAALLKFLPPNVLNRSTDMDYLPPAILTDMRYISLKPRIRDPIIESHIAALPPAPSDTSVSLEKAEAFTKQRRERERREGALADRQAQVEEEKRRQKGALQYSKGMLREGELELEKARRVGKEGLMAYMQDDNRPPLPEVAEAYEQAEIQ